MKKWYGRVIAVLCVIAVLFTGLSSCIDKKAPDGDVLDTGAMSGDTVTVEKNDNNEETVPEWMDAVSEKTVDPGSVQLPEYSGGNTVTVAAEDELYIADPFYMAEGSGADVNDFVMVSLLDTDRNGFVITGGTEGENLSYNDSEYTYNGIASVEVYGNRLVFTLDEDVYFSDGVNLTADDVIFTMYVLADPSYDGNSNFASLPIVGLPDYRGNMQPKWQAILTDLTEEYESESYTEEEKEKFKLAFEEAGVIFTRAIISGCVENFGEDYCEFTLGVDIDTLMENEGLQVAFSQFFWDYSTGYADDGLWYDSDGKSYDLKETYPTVEEYWQLIFAKHGYDTSDEGINYEKMGDEDFVDILLRVIREKYPELLTATADKSAENRIAGIEKTGTYSFEVHIGEITQETLKEFCFNVVPLHHYGSREGYKYSENKFGFTKGDLSAVLAKVETPLGAGPYAFSSAEENGDMLLVRNTVYYKGCPKIENVILTSDDSKADVIYKAYEGEGAHSENHVKANTNTYVYIGINANAVSVGGDPSSESSVSLRNAFTEAFKAYREIAVSHWENEGAIAIDDGSAWSDDVDKITESTRDDVVSCLKNAGFVWDEEQQKFTEAPEGAALSYEVMLFDYDAAYIVLNYAKDLFESIGITVEISVQTSREALENLVYAKEAQMWVMQIDDFSKNDFYDMFHTNGTENVFDVSSAELDEKIDFVKQNHREDKTDDVYEEIFSYVAEFGVIVPVYRRVDAVIYSENVVAESIAADITAYWPWFKEIHLLELK